MNWTQIKSQFPNCWVLVGVLSAHNEGDFRYPNDMEVLENFPDSVAAMKRYRELHLQDRQREMLVLHTSREAVEIEERRWVGVRA
ncbi:MAG: hypothetical protein OEW08_15510 [Gammaproteobacteria bacterium]|nr:hypothetical protein [Gammaproteobacteria bacterium]